MELKKKLMSSKPVQPKVEVPAPQPAPRPLTRASSPLSPLKLDIAESQPVSRRESTASVESGTTGGKPKKAPLTLRSLMSNRKKSSDSLAAPPAGETVTAPAPGSRLKEAPAHRAAAQVAESKTNLIRSKMISLTTKQTAEPTVAEVIAKFEQNPPPGLLAAKSPRSTHPFGVNPFAAPEPVGEALGSIFGQQNVPANEPVTASNIFAAPMKPILQVESVPVAQEESVSKFVHTRRVWLKRKLRESGIDLPAAKRKLGPQPRTDGSVAEFVAAHRMFIASYSR